MKTTHDKIVISLLFLIFAVPLVVSVYVHGLSNVISSSVSILIISAPALLLVFLISFVVALLRKIGA